MLTPLDSSSNGVRSGRACRDWGEVSERQRRQAGNRSRAAGLLGPASPGRLGQDSECRCTEPAAHRARQAEQLFNKLDDERIRGSLRSSRSTSDRSARKRRGSRSGSMGSALAGLPGTGATCSGDSSSPRPTTSHAQRAARADQPHPLPDALSFASGRADVRLRRLAGDDARCLERSMSRDPRRLTSSTRSRHAQRRHAGPRVARGRQAV